jgi:hypothetical protein
MDSAAWRHECLAPRITKQNSTAHIVKEAALQTTDRFNVKPDLVTVNLRRVHEDRGNLEDGSSTMLDKYNSSKPAPFKEGASSLPTVLGSRAAIL